jgi:hypothetical protein
MKKILLVTFLLPFIVFAQEAKSLNYQATAYDSNGSLIIAQTIIVRVSITSDLSAGSTHWIESHVVKTSVEGAFQIGVGKGSRLGGDKEAFIEIDWLSASYFLKIELDTDNNGVYRDFGTQKLLTLPYALYVEEVSKNQ